MRSPLVFLLFLVAKGFCNLNYAWIPGSQRETPSVAALYPDPNYPLDSPAFRKDPVNYTSYDEMLQFIEELRSREAKFQVTILSQSQQGRNVVALNFAQNGSAQGRKPCILIIGSQHGNELAGGEAALALASVLVKETAYLDRLNILIVPRANPDGVARYRRGLSNGDDLNRDHLLLQSPEGKALAKVFREQNPDVVIDAHEYTVYGKWLRKFGGVQRWDAMVQLATVPNLAESRQPTMERILSRIRTAFDSMNLTHEWFHTTNKRSNDNLVSMGGLVPDSGRNVAGLRNAIAFLVETRGIGIGMANFKRRVVTHMIAIRAILDFAYENPGEIIRAHDEADKEIVERAGRGSLIVVGTHTRQRRNMTLLHKDTGAPMSMEVYWNSTLELTKVLERPRPYGYLLNKEETRAVQVFQEFGLNIHKICGPLDAEKYTVTDVRVIDKDDVTGSVGGIKNKVMEIKTSVSNVTLLEVGDMFFVPLDQPLANLATAAMEPESQSSFAANFVMSNGSVVKRQPLPFFRVPRQPVSVVALNHHCSNSVAVALLHRQS